jgi:surfactin family lipopeptide synthetase C
MIDQIEDIYVLSPTQQGILFHCLYEPRVGLYIGQLSCLLRGNLNVAALKRAWRHVVNRQPALRTGFVWEGLDEPLQIVYKFVESQIEWRDLSSLSPVEQESYVDEYLKTDRRRDRDLHKPPLMNIALFRLSPAVHRLIWSSHHVIIDGWSMPLLMKELISCYDASCRGEDPRPQHTGSYRDYIAWLQMRDMSQARNFWAKELKGFATPTPIFPKKEMNPSGDHFFRDERQLRVSIEKSATIRDFARKHHLTLNTLLQGAWAAILGCYSGMEEVVFGAVVSGRPPSLPRVESVIGLFINVVPVRARLEQGRLALEWLKGLQARLVEMLEYEYYPLTDIQKLSDVPGHLPLFETILVFENYPVDQSMSEKLTGLEIEDLRAIPLSHYPLSVTVAAGSRLSFRLTFDRRRYEPTAIERIAKQMEIALLGFAAHPDWTPDGIVQMLAQSDNRLRTANEEKLDHVRLEKLSMTRRRATRGLIRE